MKNVDEVTKQDAINNVRRTTDIMDDLMSGIMSITCIAQKHGVTVFHVNHISTVYLGR